MVGGLAVAIVSIAFLLGRESARPTEAPTTAPDARAGESVAASPARPTLPPPLAAPPAGTTHQSPTVTASVPDGRRAGARVASPPPTTPPAPTADTRTRDSIAGYFETVDSLGGEGIGMGDPNEFAMMIVGESASGNFNAFDQMLRDQRASLRRLRGMNPPGELQAHHRQTIELAESGIRLMEQVKRGLESGDVTSLMTLSATAQELQSDAEAADRLATDIKRKYGLTP